MSAWAAFTRVLGIAWHHRHRAPLVIVVTTLSTAFALGSAWGQKHAVDLVQHFAASNVSDAAAMTDTAAQPTWALNDEPGGGWPFGLVPPDGWSLVQVAAVVGVIVLLFALVGAWARYGQRVSEEWFAQGCGIDIRNRLYAKLNRLSFDFYDEHETGQVINRITTDAQNVRNVIQGIMIKMGITLVTFAVFMTWMLQESWLLTLACLAPFPIQILITLRYGVKTKPRFKRQQELIDRLINRLQESIAGIRIVRAFGRSKEMTAQYDYDAEAARSQRMVLAAWQATHIPAVQAGNIASTAILIGYGGWLAVQAMSGNAGLGDGGVTIGTLVGFRYLLGRLSSQLESVIWFTAQLPEWLAGAERVFRFLDREETITDPTNAAASAPTIDAATNDEPGTLRFHDVWFRYPGSIAPETPSHADDQWVLRGVSFTVQQGETVAIVGRTGSGKSTALALAARFYDPTRGSVTLGGVDMRAMPVSAVRNRIGYVFQEPFLFSNTVHNNIAFGRHPDRESAPKADENPLRSSAAHAESAAVLHAANAAQATGFIAELDDGFETVIGERGVDLSGGQRQRLTIARAIAAEPALLILDDATTAVDPITESKIQNALDEVRSNATTLIVAHRLSTIRRADKIVVLEDGVVQHVGTHAELMQIDGHYRDAARLQLELELDDQQGDREVDDA